MFVSSGLFVEFVRTICTVCEVFVFFVCTVCKVFVPFKSSFYMDYECVRVYDMVLSFCIKEGN
jgi:hypothetical protein